MWTNVTSYIRVNIYISIVATPSTLMEIIETHHRGRLCDVKKQSYRGNNLCLWCPLHIMVNFTQTDKVTMIPMFVVDIFFFIKNYPPFVLKLKWAIYKIIQYYNKYCIAMLMGWLDMAQDKRACGFLAKASRWAFFIIMDGYFKILPTSWECWCGKRSWLPFFWRLDYASC